MLFGQRLASKNLPIPAQWEVRSTVRGAAVYSDLKKTVNREKSNHRSACCTRTVKAVESKQSMLSLCFVEKGKENNGPPGSNLSLAHPLRAGGLLHDAGAATPTVNSGHVSYCSSC